MTKLLPVILMAGCFGYTGPQQIRNPGSSLFNEKCVERKDLQPTIEAAHKAVVESCLETKLCTKTPIGRYSVCLTDCKTYCGGWFANGVHGCAGSNAVYVAVGPWSFKKLLIHEMMKNLVVSLHTSIRWDTPDREISLNPKFLEAERRAADKVHNLPDTTRPCK